MRSVSNQTLVSWLLRIGLVVVFSYAAISSFMHPDLWVGYLPSFLEKMNDAPTLLKIFSTFEIALSLLLLSGRYTRYVAFLCVIALIGIIFSQLGDLAVTFRDIGLIFMALALAVNGN
jgi:uncharacterized membrane protein YphA (DoxX/SURF4 family)